MMKKVDIKSIVLEGEELQVSVRDNEKCNIKICDVIGCQSCERPPGFLSSLFSLPPNIVIRYISKGPKYKWTAETVEVTGSEEECEALKNRIKEKLGQDKERPNKLAVFINPIGGSQNAQDVFSGVVSPLFKTANITCDVLVSERPKHMTELISSFDTASVDGLVLMGGDETILEILNVLLTKAQKEAGVDYDQPTSKLKPLEVPIGVIPTGTGNSTAKGLYGNMDIVTAVLHIIKGGTDYNNIQGVYSGGKLASFSAVLVAHGLFSDLMFEVAEKVLPLKHLLFKRQRVFNAKVTLFHRKPCSDSQEAKSDEESGTTEEKEIEGRFINVTSFAANPRLLCIPFGPSLTSYLTHPGDFVVVSYKECGKIEFLGHFVSFGLIKPDAFERDFLTPYTVRGYKVKLLDRGRSEDPDSVEAQINRILDVDGELVEIADGEYEVWNHTRKVKFYTCQ